MALELTTLDGWNFFDADDTDDASTFRIQVSQGTLTFTAGNSEVVATSGNGTSDILLTGTMFRLNALFKDQTTGTLLYGTSTIGAKTFTATLTDSTGFTDADSFTVTAFANAAPVVTKPSGVISIPIHGTATFDLTERPGWNFTDVDDTGGDDTLRIQVSQGTLDCTVGDSGVVITSGDVTSDILLTGTLAELNAFIKNQTTGTLIYSTSVAGVKTFTVTLTDTIGVPGSNTFTVTATAPVAPVMFANPGPIVVPALSTTFSLAPYAFGGWNILDADDIGGACTLRMQASGGELDCTVGDSGVTIDSGDETSDLRLSGTMEQLRQLVRFATSGGSIVYRPLIAGSKLITTTFTDSDGLSSAATTLITATAPVPPVIVAGATLQVDTGFAKDLADAGFSVTDADDSFLPATCTLGITNGAITVTSGNSGVTITSGNGTNSVILSGTIASLNSLLNSSSSGVISYIAAVSGSKTFTVTIVDSAGGSDSDTSSVVAGDRPVVAAPTLITTDQSADKNLEGLGFTVTDADAAGTNTCNLVTTVGTIDITVGNSGVTITGGDTTANVAFTGTIAQILSLLNDSSTGTIVWSPGASITTGTITCTVTDSTSRVGSAVASTSVTDASPTWTGFVTATPAAATAALTGFYAPIDLSRFPTAWWDLVTVDGRDIRCTLADNTPLPRDLVLFNRTAKTGLLVVKFNHATTPPAIRVHAGAANATAPGDADTYGRHNTYASDVRGYWPLGSGEDRTGYNNDMTLAGGAVSATVPGPFSVATAYDGVDDRAVANASIPTGYPVSIGAFIKTNTLAGFPTIVTLNSDSATDTGHRVVDMGGGQIRAIALKITTVVPVPPATATESTTFAVATAPGTVLSGSWVAAAGVFLGVSSRKAYRDLYTASNGGFQGTNLGTSPSISIGSRVSPRTPDGVSFFNGSLSHVFLWTHAASEPYVFNFARAVNQATYWTPWVFSTESLTGI
jgi:hypothetical protein